MNEKPELPTVCREHYAGPRTTNQTFSDGEFAGSEVTFWCGCTASVQFIGEPTGWVLREYVTITGAAA